MIARALAALAVLLAVPAVAAPAPVTLWRLDCGTVDIPDLDFLSDSFAFSGKARTVTVSCYLLRHGDTWMLWDTGLPLSRLGAGQRSVGGGNARLARSIADQLRDLGVGPDAISLVALSHYHDDHAGQAAQFPNARLVIGAEDWAAVRGEEPAFNLQRSDFTPWRAGGSPVDEVKGDRDLFGDGTVTMLAVPGHTPGHHALLIRLARRTVLLTGDLWHFREQLPIDGVPKINTSRADTLASMTRLRQVARNLHAALILGHEPRDIARLPAFPQGAQ